VEQHTALEGIHQAALLDVAGHKENIHTLHLEVAGLEATMRGQGRDLAELGAKLTQAEGELEAHKGRLAEREREALSKGEALQVLQEEHNLLALQLGELRQHLDETTIQHEGEKLELMNGLDQRETELIQLRQSLATQKEAQATLEREHQSLQGQLAEHRDRFQNLDAMLQEITEKLRRGSDLVRG
jgi:chromosome segregation ATPase